MSRTSVLWSENGVWSEKGFEEVDGAEVALRGGRESERMRLTVSG